MPQEGFEHVILVFEIYSHYGGRLSSLI